MSKPFQEVTRNWPKDRLERIEARARILAAEEMTLRDLRRAQELTQVQMAKTLGIGQEQISRLEQKSDMMLSTLASYVKAMGGNLQLLAEFPNRPPVTLANFSDLFEPKPAKGKLRDVP